MNSSTDSKLEIDWNRFWNFLFRLLTGIGLVTFWLFLLGLSVALFLWLGHLTSKLPFAWLLGVGAIVGIGLLCWWLSYHIALDYLSDIGISLPGFWQWLILPVAIPLAPILFLFGSISGLGELVYGRVVTILCFSLGALLVLLVAGFVIHATL